MYPVAAAALPVLVAVETTHVFIEAAIHVLTAVAAGLAAFLGVLRG